MANKNESKFREEDTPDDREPVYTRPTRVDPKTPVKERAPIKKPKPAPLDDEEVDHDTSDEDEPDTDPQEVLEFSNGVKATRQYHEALEVYDPKKREPQTAEYWEFKSSHLAKFGRF